MLPGVLMSQDHSHRPPSAMPFLDPTSSAFICLAVFGVDVRMHGVSDSFNACKDYLAPQLHQAPRLCLMQHLRIPNKNPSGLTA